MEEFTPNYNHLTSLPAEIGQLTQLKVLNLGQNQLTTLPPEIGQLAQLERLYLHQNNLNSLPLEMAQLEKLEMLFVDANLPIPAELEERNGHGLDIIR